jgi:hypothetical protein
MGLKDTIVLVAVSSGEQSMSPSARPRLPPSTGSGPDSLTFSRRGSANL